MPENLSTIHEALGEANAIRENAALKDAMAPYLSPRSLSRNPELTNPDDRLYFQSLLLSDMVPAGTDVAHATREELNPLNPLGLEIPEAGDAAGIARLGVALDPVLAPEEKKRLGGTPEAIGEAYARQAREARDAWKEGRPVTDAFPALVDAVVAHYRDCKNAIESELRAARIGAPGTNIDGGGGRNTLKREEYLQLLTLAWQGNLHRASEIIRGANGKVAAVRTGLERPDVRSATDRVQRLSATLALEEMGSGETLRRFGVEIGPVARREYVELRRSDPGFKSADVWLNDPMLAYAFLEGRLPQTASNKQFLAALERYNATDWAVPDEKQLRALDNMTPDDTKLTLQYVATSLQATEETMRGGAAEREILKRSKGPDKGVESFVSEAWKYMTDVRQHPAGSLLMWGTVILAAKMAYDMFQGRRPEWSQMLLLAVGGGAAYGLYQKHTTGKAYWDGIIEDMTGYFNKDKKKPLEEQTLPSMWAKKIDRDPRFYDGFIGFERRHTKACLSILEGQNIRTVMDWYDQMDTWEQTRDPKNMPKLPFRMTPAERGIFGKAGRDDINLLMYRTMRSFCADRGAMVRQEHLGYMLPPGVEKRDDAGLGAAYLRERYVNRQYFTRLIESTVATVTVDSEGSTTTVNMNDPASVNGALDRVVEQRPELRAIIDMARVAYLAETQTLETADWQMWHVFMTEADPETWSRMGRDGTTGASWIIQGLDWGKGIASDAAARFGIGAGTDMRDGTLPPVPTLDDQAAPDVLPPVPTLDPVPGTDLPPPMPVSAPDPKPSPAPSPSPTSAPDPSATSAPNPLGTSAPKTEPTSAPSATSAPTPETTSAVDPAPIVAPPVTPAPNPSAMPAPKIEATPAPGPAVAPPPEALPAEDPKATTAPSATSAPNPSAMPAANPATSAPDPAAAPAPGPRSAPDPEIRSAPRARPAPNPGAIPAPGPGSAPGSTAATNSEELPVDDLPPAKAPDTPSAGDDLPPARAPLR